MTACFNCTLVNYYSWSVEERKFLDVIYRSWHIKQCFHEQCADICCQPFIRFV